jgi:ligand-binding sensor domain-containing protein
MKTMALAAVLAAAVTTGSAARADAPRPRVLTGLDDARACAPLEGGGFAVGTGGGLALVRADGTLEGLLTSLDGLPDTRVHAVAPGTDGLWIGTEGGAALVVGGVVVRTVGSRAVHAVYAPPGGGVWLGTWGEGVTRLADKGATPVLVPTTAAGRHVAAITEHGGHVHVAYVDGPVTRLEGAPERPRLVEAAPGGPSHGQALASVGGRLVLGDVEGLFRVDTSAPRAIAFSSVDARGIVADGSTLLVASYGTGLLSGAQLRTEPGVPRWVRGVAATNAARCAATTDGLFVDTRDGRGWRKLGLGGLASNDVTALAASPAGDRIAIGTFDRGAGLADTTGAVRPIAGLEHDETVSAAAWQGTDRLWLGTAHGLVEVSRSGTAIRRIRAADGLPSSIVRSILVLAPDRLLVGTEEGAALVEGGRITPLAPGEKGAKGSRAGIDSPAHATWALARTAAGRIFLGTSTGLYWSDSMAGPFARASVATEELRDDWVTALSVVDGPDGRSDVFVGTYSGGVTRLVFTGAARPRAVHLGGGYVNPGALGVRGGEITAATMDGLLTRPLGDDAASWRSRFDAATGRDVTAAEPAFGGLWVASRRGIAVVAR